MTFFTHDSGVPVHAIRDGEIGDARADVLTPYCRLLGLVGCICCSSRDEALTKEDGHS